MSILSYFYFLFFAILETANEENRDEVKEIQNKFDKLQQQYDEVC